MREVKFRGQMTTGEWVYGLPHLDLPGSTAYFNECSYRICWSTETGGSANAPIKNGTLGQFTGLKDKNETEIYEGDVIELVNDAGETIRVTCEYGIARRYVMSGGLGTEVDIPSFYFKLSNGKRSFPIVRNYAGKHDLQIFEVVGNIYEKNNKF